MKTCKKCKYSKSESEFYKFKKNGKDYRRGTCRTCVAKKVRTKKKNQTEEEKLKWKEYNKSWHLKNPDYILKTNLKRKYGLTLDQFNKMLESQNGVCKICKSPDSGISHSDRLFVDHCHKTNKIRGLLCNRCNSILGFANDCIETLEKSIQYLRNYNI
jgi:hypothetical protein